MNTWKLIFYKVRKKHPNWSRKQVMNCTRYAYKRRNKYKTDKN